MTTLLAFAAGAVAPLAAAGLVRGAAGPAVARGARVLAAAVAACDAVLRLGREGGEPGALERRRLLAGGTFAALAGGMLLLGPLLGLLLGGLGPAAVARILNGRRAAYRRALERDAPAIALAVADPLSAGHSLRGALHLAAAGLGGPGGAELDRLAGALAAGEPTEPALDALRTRCGTPAIDALVAAWLVHRRSGGELAKLLRGLARAFEDAQRLEDEVRTATAQARFTGVLVVLLPLGGALLAELATPGFLAGLAGSPLTAWLVGSALLLQAVAAVLIRRLGRVAG